MTGFVRGAGPAPGRFTGHEPAAGRDTAGVPWAGRHVTDTGFGADEGEPDPAVRAALRALAALEDDPATPTSTRHAAEAEVVRRLREGRVLVPVVAAPAVIDAAGGASGVVDAAGGASGVVDAAGGASGVVDAAGAASGVVDASGVVGHGSEMATPALTAPDGRRGLPVFTGLDRLSAWDAGARPVPVPAVMAARSALEDGCEVLLVDLGDADAAVLRLSHAWALAQGREWRPPNEDPVVLSAIAAAAGGRPELVDARGEPHPAAGVLRLVLEVEPALDGAQVQALAADVAAEIAADVEARCRLDGVAIEIRPAGGSGAQAGA